MSYSFGTKPDLIPEGFLSLREAYGQFRYWLWNGLDLEAELQSIGILVEHPSREESLRQELEAVRSQELRDFIALFKSGALESLVRDPRSPDGRDRIPAAEWSTAFFPEHVAIADQIEEGHSDYFDELMGRTALVGTRELNKYLESHHSERSGLLSVRWRMWRERLRKNDP